MRWRLENLFTAHYAAPEGPTVLTLTGTSDHDRARHAVVYTPHELDNVQATYEITTPPRKHIARAAQTGG